MSKKLAIGVDLDGVCYDFDGSFIHYLTEYRGIDPTRLPRPQRWEFWPDWGMEFDEWLQYFNEGVDDRVIFMHGHAAWDSKFALKRLKSDGHTVHIVTHRQNGRRAVENTVDWLRREQIPHDTLTFAKDKTVIKTDLFIEDNVDNYNALREAGVEAWIVDRPWNINYDVPHRVQNWNQFLRIVDAKNRSGDLTMRA